LNTPLVEVALIKGSEVLGDLVCGLGGLALFVWVLAQVIVGFLTI
jgi:hypothetical protein